MLEEGQAKCLKEGFVLLRDMFKIYTRSANPNKISKWLQVEWQKTKDEIEAGTPEVYEQDDEVHEATTDVSQSSRNSLVHAPPHMKYELTIRKTGNGVRIIRGPGNGVDWKGKILDRCHCVYHRRFFKICDMKELEAAKTHHCIRCIDEFYTFLNPEDREVNFRMRIEEHSQDVMRLTWTGKKPDLRDLKHHTSRCIKWIAVENVRHNRKFCMYCKKFRLRDVRGCRKYQKRYGKRPSSPMI